MGDEHELLTPAEAVSYLGLDRQGLRDPREALRWLCRTGKLRYAKIGRRILFRREWLEELIDENVTCRRSSNPRMEEKTMEGTDMNFDNR